MDVLGRLNVRVSGIPKAQPIVFAHGFGCDQNMWRFVAPHFEQRYKVVLFDLAGAGAADPAAYEPDKYSSLDGYADDILEICERLELSEVIFVGHSVSAMTGVLASLRAPSLFAHLVLIGPSPCYINGDGYFGGFSQPDIAELLDSLDSNYLGWSAAMAPAIMGNPDRPQLGQELTESFCRTDPEIARRFARVTFLSDNRGDLPKVRTPTLILQCRNDAIAPVQVGQYVHQAIPNSSLTLLDATGHCPHLSSPAATIEAIDAFLMEHTPS